MDNKSDSASKDAHMNAHLDAFKNPSVSPLDNLSLYTNNISAGTGQRGLQTIPATDRYLVIFPSSIAGNRCYTDAATTPDIDTSVTKQAGLGVLLINTDEHPPTSIFIKAIMQVSSSVIMEESAALAFAANLLNQLQCRRSTILSNNQQLVHFLNEFNHSNPPCVESKEAKTKWLILWQDRIFRPFAPIT